jgi:hypothetical protein
MHISEVDADELVFNDAFRQAALDHNPAALHMNTFTYFVYKYFTIYANTPAFYSFVMSVVREVYCPTRSVSHPSPQVGEVIWHCRHYLDRHRDLI